MNEKLLEHFSKFITENKKNLIEKNLPFRTRHITLVLEDIFQPHNASATLRTCECLGIQDIHIIENINKYKLNPNVVMGSSKWLTLYRYNKNSNNTQSAILSLKEKGYKIIATSPHYKGKTPTTLPLETKSAILFGTELTGLSNEALELADEYIQIPMFGFTESFNISVSVALVLSRIIERLHNSSIDWKLSKQEKEELRLNWYRKSIKNSHIIEEEFLEKISLI
jgi:tRNA (guanosine-2'-O-)-methyltransferase